MIATIQDSMTMLGRELKHTQRFPLALIGSIVVPVVMLLLFNYISAGPSATGWAPLRTECPM